MSVNTPEAPSPSPEEIALEKGREVYEEYREKGEHLLSSRDGLDSSEKGIERELAELAKEAHSLAARLDQTSDEKSSQRYTQVLDILRGIGRAAEEDRNVEVFEIADSLVHWD